MASQPNGSDNPDRTELVRRGYDALSHHYRGDDDLPECYAPWIAALDTTLDPASRVLDLGCGNGVPMAKALTEAGHTVTGVDFSATQIARARALVPAAEFRHADAHTLDLPDASYNAVVCLYMLFHLPRTRQPDLLRRVATWLRPGGWLLATTGAHDCTSVDHNWLGGPAPMWWSHPGAATYRTWITEAGLSITSERFVPEGDGGHQLFWARRDH